MPPMPAAVALCLACSSSLPPQKAHPEVYYTQCCSRPICPNCISTNPRLARYNPCLRCLAGVHAVKTRSSADVSAQMYGVDATKRINVDGSVRDEDVFVVEDDEDTDLESDTGEPVEGQSIPQATVNSSPIDVSSPSYERADKTRSRSPPDQEADSDAATTRRNPLPQENGIASSPASDAVAQQPTSGLSGTPPRYYIRPDDTLLGISLKLGVDGRVLCRLNNLPVSTLRTTPHLLHTRGFLTLPPSISAPPPVSPAEQAADEERRARLARERAETRFQAMTKEADRGVAKAYVALAGLPDGEDEIKAYDKERGLRKRRVRTGEDDGGEGSLEGQAMDRYFDDEEWEARERAEGRKAALPPFPYAAAGGSSTSGSKTPAGGEKSWWRWKS